MLSEFLNAWLTVVKVEYPKWGTGFSDFCPIGKAVLLGPLTFNVGAVYRLDVSAVRTPVAIG